MTYIIEVFPNNGTKWYRLQRRARSSAEASRIVREFYEVGSCTARAVKFKKKKVAHDKD